MGKSYCILRDPISVQQPRLLPVRPPNNWVSYARNVEMNATLNEPFMRATDVQQILRLVGGAAELWYQPQLQRQFTLDSLCRILGAKVGVCYTIGDVLYGGKTPCDQFTHVGLDEKGAKLFENYLASGTPRDPVLDVMAVMPGRVITFTRREAVADADWFNSDHYKQIR